MTAARHARPPAASRPLAALGDAARPVLAGIVALAVVFALIIQAGQAASTTPAVRWHYPCVMHRAQVGHLVIESFTPAASFWKGLCLQ